MRTTLLGLLVSTVALLGADVSGKWKGSFEVDHGQGETRDIGIYLELKQDGANLTGVAGQDETRNWAIHNGKLDGDKLTFDVQQDDGPVIRFVLVLRDGRIQGEARAERDGRSMTGKVNVTRKAD